MNATTKVRNSKKTNSQKTNLQKTNSKVTKSSINEGSTQAVKTKGKIFTTKTMITVSLLSALAYVLMLLESPPYIGFLKLEFSDIPAIIGAFQFGPVAGIIIELIKNLFKTITSSTAGIGELANFVVSVAYVVPAAIIFRKMKSKYKSIIAFGIATICMIIAGFLINYFVTIPLYASLYGGIDNIVALATAIPGINDKATLVLYGITPFNLVKGIFLGVVGHYTYRLLKNRL